MTKKPKLVPIPKEVWQNMSMEAFRRVIMTGRITPDDLNSATDEERKERGLTSPADPDDGHDSVTTHENMTDNRSED